MLLASGHGGRRGAVGPEQERLAWAAAHLGGVSVHWPAMDKLMDKLHAGLPGVGACLEGMDMEQAGLSMDKPACFGA
ncbi:hypothetical protein SABR111722_15490 [Saccharibacillus brassicae]